MRKELWAKIKTGDVVITADEYSGPFRATVIEVDIAIESTEKPLFKEHPYGLTKDTGTIKIRYDTTEQIANLEQLIKYSAQRLEKLQGAWNRYKTALATSSYLLEQYQAMITRELIY